MVGFPFNPLEAKLLAVDLSTPPSDVFRAGLVAIVGHSLAHQRQEKVSVQPSFSR